MQCRTKLQLMGLSAYTASHLGEPSDVSKSHLMGEQYVLEGLAREHRYRTYVAVHLHHNHEQASTSPGLAVKKPSLICFAGQSECAPLL